MRNGVERKWKEDVTQQRECKHQQSVFEVTKWPWIEQRTFEQKWEVDQNCHDLQTKQDEWSETLADLKWTCVCKQGRSTSKFKMSKTRTDHPFGKHVRRGRGTQITQQETILKLVEIFGDIFDREVVALVLEECEWKGKNRTGQCPAVAYATFGKTLYNH
jgi:hypothetical protein